MVRTNIWKETIGVHKDKYVCQIFDDDHKNCKVIEGDTYEECSKKVLEEMYGER